MTNEAPDRAVGRRRHRLVLYTLLACLFVIAWLAVLVFRHFLITLTVSAAIALLLSPMNTRLAAYLGGRRTAAASILVAATVLVILIPLLTGATMIGSQTASLLLRLQPSVNPEALGEFWSETLPERLPFWAAVKDWLQLDRARLSEMLSPALSSFATVLTRLLQGALVGLVQVLAQLILFLFVLFFLLRDGPQVADALRSISPLSEVQEAEAFDHLMRTIKGVLLSMVLVPLAQGILAMIGFTIFGLPAALFWGAMLIVAAVIPGIGSPLVWAPAGIYLIASGHPGRGVGLLIYGAIVISTIDNILKPIILRGSAKIHPLLGFLSIIGGLLSFGVLGFLIGPIILSLLLSAFRIYRMYLVSPDADGEKPSPAPANSG
ncbi:MAG: AI-2E family transporter [Acidobacteriota bacterium]